MQFSAEILDHIFSFLVSHEETLVACSKDPLLAPIVERHRYYHIVVRIGNETVNHSDSFEPDHLSRLISENPRILFYAKILSVDVDCSPLEQDGPWAFRDVFRDFSTTLLMFPALECIILTGKFRWTSVFRAALADRLNLPSFKEMHLYLTENFPFSLFDDCKHIKNLLLSGAFKPQGPEPNSPLPQLRSLTLYTDQAPSLLAWLKLHITELQSLKCGVQAVGMLPALLEVCSMTLTKLEVDLEGSPYFDDYTYKTGTAHIHPFPDLYFVPRNLQHLTIRTAMYQYHSDNGTLSSWLLAACKIISLFTSLGPPRHLVIEIGIEFSTFEDLTEIDLSPLAVLGAASLSIPRIDLYVLNGMLPRAVTRAQLLSVLEDYEGIVTSIKQGVLVIHPEEIPLDCIQEDWTSASIIQTN